MRVVIVVNDLAPYGSQRVAVLTAAELERNGWDAELVTLEEPAHDDLGLGSALARSSLRRSQRGPRGLLQMVVRLRGRLSVGPRPDVVLSHMTFANIVTLASTATLTRSRPAVVITEHSVPRNVSLEPAGWALAMLCRMLYPRATGVLGVSEAACAEIAEEYRVPARRLRRVYNPVDIAVCRAVGDGPAPHPWLCASRGQPTVVAVGGLRRVKGHADLLAALALVPDLRCLLVGSGPEESRLRSLAGQLEVTERVDFVGYRDDAVRYMAHSDGLIMPSWWEGFGLAVVEAGAVGTPVLVTDTSGLRELVPAVVPGIVASSGISGLAQGIRDLVGRTWTSAPDSAFNPFAPSAVGQEYMRVIQDLTGVGRV